MNEAWPFDVTFRLGKLGVPVIAEFTAPGAADRRHAHRRGGRAWAASSKLTARHWVWGLDGLPRTAVLEAVIAHSDRPNFGKGLVAAPVIKPLMRAAAARLWRDDLAYAERLYALRSGR